jgi:hypothetical protein
MTFPWSPLEAFAFAVLEILETDEDWSADTLDGIAAEAHRFQLGTSGGNGMFVRTDAGKPPATCTCDLRTKLVGDGCSVCNPGLAAELNS